MSLNPVVLQLTLDRDSTSCSAVARAAAVSSWTRRSAWAAAAARNSPRSLSAASLSYDSSPRAPCTMPQQLSEDVLPHCLRGHEPRWRMRRTQDQGRLSSMLYLVSKLRRAYTGASSYGSNRFHIREQSQAARGFTQPRETLTHAERAEAKQQW